MHFNAIARCENFVQAKKSRFLVEEEEAAAAAEQAVKAIVEYTDMCVLLKGGWAEIRQHCKKLMFVNESQQSPSRKQTDISTKSDFDSNLE